MAKCILNVKHIILRKVKGYLEGSREGLGRVKWIRGETIVGRGRVYDVEGTK